MKQTPASRKTSEILREKVASIILLEISDPRLDMITVTDVDVSKDRSMADVYVSADKERYEEVSEGLESAKGRIRSLAGKSLDWRVTPELRFHIDSTVDTAERIASALEGEQKWQNSITPLQ
jgi:ribosome-binding factor A